MISAIQDFKSIRFIRMFLKDFEEDVVLRFAKLELVRGEWRKYELSLIEGHENLSTPEFSNGTLDISSVNIEENSDYVLLITEEFLADELPDLEPGSYVIKLQPSGTIIANGVETVRPTASSIGVQITTDLDDPNGQNVELNFDVGVEWS